MAQNLPRGTPARVLVLLALLLGLTAVSTWRDALQRDTASWVRHPTALGDASLFLPGQAPARLSTDGKNIILIPSKSALHRRDDHMFRVTTGFGESLPFSVFSTRSTLQTEAEPRLYARTAPHTFRRLRVTTHLPHTPANPAHPVSPVIPVSPVSPPLASPAKPSPSPPEEPIRKAIPLALEEQDSPVAAPPKVPL